MCCGVGGGGCVWWCGRLRAVNLWLACVVWWILTWSRIMRRRMLVWCVVGVVVVGRRRMRRMMYVVVVLWRRMRMDVCPQCDGGFTIGTLKNQDSLGPSIPELEELVQCPLCGVHGVVVVVVVVVVVRITFALLSLYGIHYHGELSGIH
jgi:hypothetical protein